MSPSFYSRLILPGPRSAPIQPYLGTYSSTYEICPLSSGSEHRNSSFLVGTAGRPLPCLVGRVLYVATTKKKTKVLISGDSSPTTLLLRDDDLGLERLFLQLDPISISITRAKGHVKVDMPIYQFQLAGNENGKRFDVFCQAFTIFD